MSKPAVLPEEVATKLVTDIIEYETIGAKDAGNVWIIIAGALVFFMHAGFAMLEAGSVRNMNKINILFKNIGTVTIGALCYYVLGYGFAYGLTGNSFIGGTSFAGSSLYADESSVDDNEHNAFFFQFAFCVTAATIVSGAVAGRIKLEGYFILAAYMTTFVYPVVSHWVWSSDGWLSAFESGKDFLFKEDYPFACGVFDYAGSGVVHMTGGVGALVAAIILGPRVGRFGEAKTDMPGHNLAMSTLGTLILWFGWYGFNCGSTLAFDGANASKVAVTTSLAPAAACITCIIVQKKRTGKYDLPSALNAILGGLVSITAGCSVVEDWAAIPIGVVGAFIYLWAANLLEKFEIDDPIGAFPVHGACGAWGVIAVAIFGNAKYVNSAYSTCQTPLEETSGTYWAPLPGYQFAVQMILVIVVTLWVVATFTPVVFLLKKLGMLRTSEEDELAGLDSSEHYKAATFAETELKQDVDVKPAGGASAGEYSI